MKQYNGENAIISLTSWKKRISTTSTTIFSLLKNCPGFHIVLVLSEDEFPNKENDLPRDLIVMCKSNLFELLWIKEDFKVYKKIVFTMAKYKSIPIISADDGCIYVRNYANDLYNIWLKNKSSIVSTVCFGKHNIAPGCGGGYGVLYPPNCFKDVALKCITQNYNMLLQNQNDDRFFACLIYCMKLNVIYISTHKFIRKHPVFINNKKDELNGLTKTNSYLIGDNWKFFEIINTIL